MSSSKIPGCVGHLQSIRRPDLLRMVQNLKAEKHLKTIEKKRKPKVSFIKKQPTRNELCMAINMRRKEISARKFLLLLGPALVALLFGGVKVWQALKNPAVLEELEMKTISLAKRAKLGKELVEKSKTMPIRSGDGEKVDKKYHTLAGQLSKAELGFDLAKQRLKEEKAFAKQQAALQKELQKQVKNSRKNENNQLIKSLVEEGKRNMKEQKAIARREAEAKKEMDKWRKNQEIAVGNMYDIVPTLKQSIPVFPSVPVDGYQKGSQYGRRAKGYSNYGKLDMKPKAKTTPIPPRSYYQQTQEKPSKSDVYLPLTDTGGPYGSLRLIPTNRQKPPSQNYGKLALKPRSVSMPVGTKKSGGGRVSNQKHNSTGYVNLPIYSKKKPNGGSTNRLSKPKGSNTTKSSFSSQLSQMAQGPVGGTKKMVVTKEELTGGIKKLRRTGKK